MRAIPILVRCRWLLVVALLSWPVTVAAQRPTMGAFEVTGSKETGLTVTAVGPGATDDGLRGHVGDTFGIDNFNDEMTVRLVDAPPGAGPPVREKKFRPGESIVIDTTGWVPGTYVLEFDPTPVTPVLATVEIEVGFLGQIKATSTHVHDKGSGGRLTGPPVEP